jgi:transcriptional regulator with XRE-family HTH domain
MSKTRKPRGVRASEEGLKKVQRRMAELEKPEDKEKKGWSQEDLEKRSGAHISTVKRFLSRQPIDTTRAIWITQALGFELTEVFEQNESSLPLESSEPDQTASLKSQEDELDGLEEQKKRSLITVRAVPLNPFVPLAGIVDNAQQFFNREQEIQRIFDVFNSGGSVALIGEEGIGKSSLLKAICRQAESRLHSPRQPVYLDLNGVCDEDDFYSALCHEVGIPESKGYRLTRELRSHRLLLALDNLGKITCEGFSHHVRDQLRGLAEGSDAPLRLLLSATKPLDSLFEDSQDGNKTSPLAGICQEEYLEPWDEPTARAFISARLALTAVQFTEEEISQLVQESHGYPQRLMLLCNQTYSRYMEGVQ